MAKKGMAPHSATTPQAWIIADDWEALERYQAELSRRLPGVRFDEIPFARTALERLCAHEKPPQVAVVDLTSEDCTAPEFREALPAESLLLSSRWLWIGEGEWTRPFSYDSLAAAIQMRLFSSQTDD